MWMLINVQIVDKLMVTVYCGGSSNLGTQELISQRYSTSASSVLH